MSVAKKSIEEVDRLGKVSKFSRMWQYPIKYFIALGYRMLIYPITKKPLYRAADLFFGEQMEVALPGGTDIYLTGGKSHDSEIRLAKYFINTLNDGDIVIDVGAHFGYFTRLANNLVSPNGQVFAFEPSKETFQVLQKNCKDFRNISILPSIVSEQVGEQSFVSFDSLHSEYASTAIDQYDQESWYESAKPIISKVASTSLDYFLESNKLQPQLVKIDAEGGELSVLKGGRSQLALHQPVVIMEYLVGKSKSTYSQCVDFMEDLGFNVFLIDASGALSQVTDVERTLQNQGIDSDNVVFLHL